MVYLICRIGGFVDLLISESALESVFSRKGAKAQRFFNVYIFYRKSVIH